jgi:hypothetical protein
LLLEHPGLQAVVDKMQTTLVRHWNLYPMPRSHLKAIRTQIAW